MTEQWRTTCPELGQVNLLEGQTLAAGIRRRIIKETSIHRPSKRQTVSKVQCGSKKGVSRVKL